MLKPLYFLMPALVFGYVFESGDCLPSARHTSPGEHSVADRVGTDEAVSSMKPDVDHDEVVNVFEIFANSFRGELRVAVLDNQVSSDVMPRGYFVCDIAGNSVLAVSPVGRHLTPINIQEHKGGFLNSRGLTLLLLMYKPCLE